MAEQSLISKKSLLEKYSISYGALYRWKRKGLIPEDWFIKKATPTGQETFFPSKLVCERIELILSKKEEVLLDELAMKLTDEEKSNRSLTIITEFGEKAYRLSDISEAYLVNEDGEKESIIEILKNFKREG